MTLNFVNQNDVILVKKQKSTGLQPGFDRVLPGQPGRRVNPSDQPGHTGFFLSPFFLQPGKLICS